MTALCDTHSMPYCRLCSIEPDDRIEIPGSNLKAHPPTQKPRKEMKRGQIKKSASKVTRMSSNAEIQEVMLHKGRCWLADCVSHTCTDGHSQRAHVVPQQTIRDTFELGAFLGLGGWKPIEEWTPLRGKTVRTLQVILDDPRNLVPVCPNGNVDGLEMVEALGELGYPPGFEDYQREYGWAFNDRYWYREVKPVVLDPRAAA